MPADAHVSHQAPGRLRVKIPSRKGESHYFAQLTEAFRELSGVERLEVNPLTGSLLVISDRSPQEIAEFGAQKGLFRLHHPAPTTLARGVASSFSQLNRRLLEFTGGEIDLPSLTFLALVSAGIYQISIGNLTAPAWYTAFWYGMNICSDAAAGGPCR